MTSLEVRDSNSIHPCQLSLSVMSLADQQPRMKLFLLFCVVIKTSASISTETGWQVSTLQPAPNESMDRIEKPMKNGFGFFKLPPFGAGKVQQKFQKSAPNRHVAVETAHFKEK